MQGSLRYPSPNEQGGGVSCTTEGFGLVEICSWGLAWAPVGHAEARVPPGSTDTHTHTVGCCDAAGLSCTHTQRDVSPAATPHPAVCVPMCF